jgi:Ca2+-transporting ATPase
MDNFLWHNLSFEEAIRKTGGFAERGFSESEAEVLREKFGRNELPKEKPVSKIKIFFEQFKSPLIYILVIAGAVTFVLREISDSIVIFGSVILNVVIGYVQENRAVNALNSLKNTIKGKALVLRDGEEKEVLQSELVPGDIIFLRPGNKVPADARIIECQNLKINESALTGEWAPAEKTAGAMPEETGLADRDNMVHMGTMVEEGKGTAVVVKTGVKTEIGKIAESLKEAKEEKTPYQKKLAKFSRLVGAVVVLICLAIFLEGIFKGGSFSEMFTVAVAIAVSAIPEGLPVAMTVILAVGMQKILKNGGLVRRLASAETLGSTSIIATDKTGTLTEAKMRLAGIFAGSGDFLPKETKPDVIDLKGKKAHILALKIATISNDAFIENLNKPADEWILRGSPTEKALLLAGVQAGFSKKELEKTEFKLAELPFSSNYKYAATLHKIEGDGEIIYAIGAPEAILEFSEFIETDSGPEKIESDNLRFLSAKQEELTLKGLTSLAIAYKKTGDGELLQNLQKSPKESSREKIYRKNLRGATFVAFAALHDPIRADVKQSIEICRAAGMRPIMITGDHKLTAMAIGNELGFKVADENILEGRDLDSISDEEFKKKFEKIEIYARTEPTQKLRIIKAWQEKGHVVAMTGDGINDAPALKQADIGVAVGSGTDVAKDAADLVLLDDSFSIIVSAVEKGRAILDNIRKVITYLFANAFTEVILIMASLIAGLPLPITAVQILWINLIEDGLPDIALAFEKEERGIMKRKPQKLDAPLLNGEMKSIALTITFATSLILLLFFFGMLSRGYGIDYIRTFIFSALGLGSLAYAFSCKSLKRSVFKINILDNPFLVFAWILGIGTLFAAVYVPALNSLLGTVPLPLSAWWFIIGITVLDIMIIESVKHYFIIKSKTD